MTPSDDEEEGASETSTSLTIQNSPPLTPTLAFDPEDPNKDDELICVIDTDSTDQDEDDVTYTFTWEVDGVAYTDAEDTYETGDTVPSIDTAANEVWTCTVTPNDGTEDGADASESVAIAPDEEVFYVSLSDLVGLSDTCSSTPYEHMYNGCGSNWGVSWTDPNTATPTQVTVDFYQGIDCSYGSDTRYVYNNGSSLGTTTMYFYDNCDCEPGYYGYWGGSTHEESYSFTDMSYYNVGDYNTLTFQHDSCEGMSTNSSWGGYYAIVTVEY